MKGADESACGVALCPWFEDCVWIRVCHGSHPFQDRGAEGRGGGWGGRGPPRSPRSWARPWRSSRSARASDPVAPSAPAGTAAPEVVDAYGAHADGGIPGAAVGEASEYSRRLDSSSGGGDPTIERALR